MNDKRQKIDRQIKWTLWTLAGALLGGEVSAAFAVSVRTGAGRGWAAVLWGGAFAVIGFVVGFLFGVPRSASNDDKSRLTVNTNLEQISDWLTKLITGAALANLRELPADIKLGGEYVAKSLGGCPPGQCQNSGDLASVGGAIFCFFLALGFLFGYLATRTFFTRLFADSDSGLDAAVDNLPPDAKDSLSNAPVNFDHPPPKLDALAQKAATTLESAPVTSDSSPETLSLVAKAKLMAGKWGEAIDAYRKAIEAKPGEPDTLLEYAYALRNSGSAAPTDVQKVLELAVNQVRGSTDRDLRRRVYESASFQALYLPPPGGYYRAIQLGEEYTHDASNPASAHIWVNLACAYGQQIRWNQANRPDTALKPLRDLALAAVKEAIRLDPSRKDVLHSLMCPSPAQKEAGEDDLAVFAGDDDFKALLGACA
jgi:hypothetical protein